MAHAWTARDIPDLSGTTAVVTGANSGLGYQTSLALAAKGAKTVLACRNPAKAKGAVEAITSAHPEAQVETMELDLASLASIAAFAERFAERYPRLDRLVNNAGVMALPYRKTADGFEMQIGTNHLGHFALTGRLLPRLLAAEGARVVNVSSTAHRIGRMNFDDLHGERSYRRWLAYGQSKLANLLFTFELGRRVESAGKSLIAAAAHPGYAATNLQFVAAKLEGRSWMERVMDTGNRIFAQDAAGGALPSLYAATAEDTRSGDYFGPDGIGEIKGHPKRVGTTGRARNEQDAARLWELSEQLTGVRYAFD